MQYSISPFVMVIFGATGDLTARKLMPALYRLLLGGVIPDRFFVVGVARRSFSHEEFRNLMKEAIVKYQKSPPKTDQPRAENIKYQISDDKFKEIWEKLEKNLYYQQGFFEDEKPYQELVKLLATFDHETGACITRFFYLATPPQHYSAILSNLDTTKLDEGCGQGSSKWTRVLIEKPFGKDLSTAMNLEQQLKNTFEERQIYRIDHYLAKETIQNIMVFRFANSLFELLWNKDHIDHIQFTLAESGGVSGRGKFYEGVGASRDVAQNHLMAMLAYITMEEPASYTAADIRHERVRVLDSIRCIDEKDVQNLVVRGQYEGYRDLPAVDRQSMTETYIAFKLFIDNRRWQDVPFYFRTGKKMARSEVRIDVQFKDKGSKLLKNFIGSDHVHVNTLTIRVQPREGITIKFYAKTPGLSLDLSRVTMNFSYSHSFKRDITDSYDKLLIDCMLGDQTFFATGAGFKATWEIFNTVLNAWEKSPAPKFPNYEAGSFGPKEADVLLEKDGRHWLWH